MPFRILSFCGGGIRGLLSSILLNRMNYLFYAEYGEWLHHKADMFAGTSTGSMLAGMLTVDIPPQAIVDFYRNDMRALFANAGSSPDAPALPTNPVVALLANKVDFPLTALPKKVLITSFDLGSAGTPWSPQLFHNFNTPACTDIGLLAAMAGSGAMPGMTAPHQVTKDLRSFNLVDGAFAHHDPTLPAIALATANGVRLDDITAIDFGTGFMRNMLTASAQGWGANQWINGDGGNDGTLPPLLLNTPASQAQMPVFNMCLNGTSTNLMPDLAKMLLGDRFAYLNPDFGTTYIPEDAHTDAQIDFLVEQAVNYPIADAMTVLRTYWADRP